MQTAQAEACATKSGIEMATGIQKETQHTAAAAGVADASTTISRWWRLFGALLITLAFGTLYAWSVFVAPLENEFGWKRAQTSVVFTLAVVTFSASLLLAGKISEKLR